jgi:regulator of cell morphogenesis and NO signaling
MYDEAIELGRQRRISMNLIEQKTVGEIASENPATVRVFEKYQIDFCCGGKMPIEEACRQRGIDADGLMAELEKVSSEEPKESKDWASASLDELIAHILNTHHAYLREELPRLTRMAAKVAEAHGERHGRSLVPLQSIVLELRNELESHMWKEEMVLFPLIRNLEAAKEAGTKAPPAHCGSVNNPIRVMEHEHDAAGQALEEMRRLTDNYTLPQDACNTYKAFFYEMQEFEKDMHRHIHLENNILFPRASKLEAALS